MQRGLNASRKPGLPSVPQKEDPSKPDAIEFEFNYYCILIRDLQPFMPDDEREKEKIGQWIHFLVNPLNEAQQLEFREKRNLYLFLICSGLLSGNVIEFMNLSRKKHKQTDKKAKPARVRGLKGPLPPAKVISNDQGFPLTLKDAISPTKLANIEDVCNRAEWEKFRYWEVRIANKNDGDKASIKSAKSRVFAKKDENKCSVHGPGVACPEEKAHAKVGTCLDKQFNFLLSLAESYKDVLSNDANNGKMQRVNLWIQALAMIDKTACTYMKGIRNDYAMVLVGYLVCGELKGPFDDLPPQTLQPLTQAIATYMEKRALKEDGDVPLNPAGDTIENFMCDVPSVEEGAFALLALSGNLFNLRR